MISEQQEAKARILRMATARQQLQAPRQHYARIQFTHHLTPSGTSSMKVPFPRFRGTVSQLLAACVTIKQAH